MAAAVSEPVVIGFDPGLSINGHMVVELPVTLLLPDVPPRGKPFSAPLL